jgi:hypothetical protein
LGSGAPQTFPILGYLNCSFAFISLALLIAVICRNVVLSGIFSVPDPGIRAHRHRNVLLGPHGTLGDVAYAGRVLLFAAAFLAYDMGAAMVINSSWQRTMLPLFGEP